MSFIFGSRYPWTNLHELNLDWIIARIKEISAQGEAMQQATTESKAATTAANTAAARVNEALADIDSTIDAGFERILSGVGDYVVNKTGNVQIKGSSTVIESGTGITMGANNGDIDIKAERTGAVSRINFTAGQTNIKGEFNVQNTNGGFDLVNTTVRKALEVVYNGILQLFGIDNGETKPVVISGIETVTDAIAATPETRANLAASCGYVDNTEQRLNAVLNNINTTLATLQNDITPVYAEGTYDGTNVTIQTGDYESMHRAWGLHKQPVILQIYRSNLSETAERYRIDLMCNGVHTNPVNGDEWLSFTTTEYDSAHTRFSTVGVSWHRDGRIIHGVSNYAEN